MMFSEIRPLTIPVVAREVNIKRKRAVNPGLGIQRDIAVRISLGEQEQGAICDQQVELVGLCTNWWSAGKSSLPDDDFSAYFVG